MAVSSQLVLLSGGCRVYLDYVFISPVKEYIPRFLGGVILGVNVVVIRTLPGVLCDPIVVISVVADFGWIPRGAVSSCTLSTGMHGCFGWDGDWTGGAFVLEHLCGPGVFLLHPVRAPGGFHVLLVSGLARRAQEIGQMTSRICFCTQPSAWSDGGYTLKRQSTKAVGSTPHIFNVDVLSDPGRRRCHHAAPSSSKLSARGASDKFIDRVR